MNKSALFNHAIMIADHSGGPMNKPHHVVLKRDRKAKPARTWYFTVIAILVVVIAIAFYLMRSFDSDLKVLATFDGTAVGSLPMELPLMVSDLQALPDTGYIGRLSSRLGTRLPAHQSAFEGLPVHTDGVAIDVILQAHEFFGATAAELTRARRSQRRILRQLERGQYDLVVIEGQSLDRLSHDAIRSQVMDYAREMGINLFVGAYEAGYREGLPLDAGLTYMEKHPERWVAGGEDPDLNQLHDRLLNGEFSGHGPMDTLSVKMRITRSIIPLTRTVTLMKRERAHRAAMVIGAAHGPEVEHLMKTLGIRGRILDAWQ